jgi:hypothetical protein
MVSGYNFRRLQSSSPKSPLSNPEMTRNARFYNGYYVDTFSADAEARFHALEIDSFWEVGPGEAPLMQDARAEARAEHIIGSRSPLSKRGHIGTSSLCNPRASRCEGNPFGTDPVSTEKRGSGFD